MEFLLLYIWLKLDTIHLLAILLFTSAITMCFAIAFINMMNTDYAHGDEEARMWSNAKLYFKRGIWTILSLACFVMIVPTKEEAAILGGVYAIREVVTSDRVKGMASKSVEIVETYLDKYLIELKDKEKK